MRTEEIFAERLKLALEKRRMMQKDLSEAIHVSRWVVTKWCSGAQMPQSRYLPDIARALSVSIDWLMGLDNYDEEEE